MRYLRPFILAASITTLSVAALGACGGKSKAANTSPEPAKTEPAKTEPAKTDAPTEPKKEANPCKGGW